MIYQAEKLSQEAGIIEEHSEFVVCCTCDRAYIPKSITTTIAAKSHIQSQNSIVEISSENYSRKMQRMKNMKEAKPEVMGPSTSVAAAATSYLCQNCLASCPSDTSRISFSLSHPHPSNSISHRNN